MTDERCKQIMADLGMPNSRSLLSALQQVANEASQAAQAAERERAGRVCDDEARIRCEASDTHPENSPARDRCLAAARAALNCAAGVRGGEVVRSNA